MAIDGLYNDIITEHNLHSPNKRTLAKASWSHEGVNPSCGDEITLSLELEGGVIRDAAFSGSGCAISQASASVMCDLVRGRRVKEAQALADLFLGMIQGKVLGDDELETLEEAMAFENIARLPARAKCAVLSWRTLKQLDEESAAAGEAK